ncbi:hypothetical protein HYH02_013330 [Chlamydomonas schloesseri]|uniref:Secreted protein n=1 Tax=Chlamydomonas schloesseri TaxID=2026947 RepID=A0A835T2M2_9CHLO|nr:hypothetical protein HYH02_013330 [Chlamydomonas schloesseri]|eukprot:KAG2431340.1 hypothetical protein HYH02_013330 [Chlamydomonas schloesseri]
MASPLRPITALLLPLLATLAMTTSAARPAPPAAAPEVLGPESNAQYYINFGKCYKQNAEYGTWTLYYNLTENRASPGKLVFWLETFNRSPVNTTTFGTVEPADFPIRQVNFAYFNATLGVQRWSPELDRTPYRETSTWFWIQVDGQRISTCKDLKDSGRANSAKYSLKGTLNGLVKPAKQRYRIEIVKSCTPTSNAPGACSAIPDPVNVFVRAAGNVVAYSFWNVGQSLLVNGTLVKDHSWCPTQTAVVVW